MCLLQAINVLLKLLCLWSGTPLLFLCIPIFVAFAGTKNWSISGLCPNVGLKVKCRRIGLRKVGISRHKP